MITREPYLRAGRGAPGADASAAGGRQVRIDLVATFSPTGATRHQAYNAVRGTDPVIGGPRSSAGGRDNRAAILDVATCINAEEPMHYRLNSTTVIARNIEIETGKPSSMRQTMLN